MKNKWKQLALCTALFGAVGCGDSNEFGPNPGPNPDLKYGQSSFVSADAYAGQSSPEASEQGSEANNTNTGADEDGGRQAEQGDIYRVSESDGLILNLNAYRGLQIIDFSNPADPKIVGRAQISGTPVEMYQVGNRVYVLMNNWWGYYGARTDVASQYNGGVVAVVDISDSTNPQIVDRAQVPGRIRTSRLTRGGGKESLYVAANDYSTDTTYVKSFSVSEKGLLTTRSEIDLDGNITDIQATGERLMVARWDWNQTTPGTEVALIDISDPNGTMVEGASVRVKGRVAKKSDMSIHDNVLRVVSANSWDDAADTNYMETFDVTNISNITPIDSDTFGDGQDLFATLFLDDCAFAVTYERVDPFHAFSISDTGMVVEESEFIVSGFNTWFRAVSNETRLIGIGINDENGTRSPAVSLYDITDLTNANPLVDREELTLNWSWSEANWDDRAFSVLENGANVRAESGELETGLVLLPFSGWDSNTRAYVSGVQIYTFSDTTVSLRGTMMHDTQVRRSFVADGANNLTGNLSEVELSLYDTSNVDAPTEVSRLELAPNYSHFMVFGNHALRRSSKAGYWGWWGHESSMAREDVLEVVSRAEHPDTAAAITEIAIPAYSKVYQVDDAIIVVSNIYDNGQVETTATSWDLSNPTTPVMRDTFTTTGLSNDGSHYGYEDDWGYGYYSDPATVVGDALVFKSGEYHRELVGREIVDTYSVSREECGDGSESCTFQSGYRSCSYTERLDGTRSARICHGDFVECTSSGDGFDCQPIDQADNVRTDRYEHDQYRHWVEWTFNVLDVSDLSDLKRAADVLTASDKEAVSTIVEGDKMHFTYRQPHRVSGDGRAYVKYYFKTFDFTNPSAVTAGGDINIPGPLADIDGTQIITTNALWGDSVVESSVNRLELVGGAAYLRSTRRFRDKAVNNVVVDGGHVLVSHVTPWLLRRDSDDDDRDLSQLSVLSATGAMTELATIDIDAWASLRASVSGRTIFEVPGGILVVNTSNGSTPYGQSFFPMRGWSNQLTLNGDSVYVAGGLYGMYELDLTESNLLTAR